jgi:hypothetical protein
MQIHVAMIVCFICFAFGFIGGSIYIENNIGGE